MNQLEVLVGKLNKTADKAARKNGFHGGTLTPQRDGSVFICLWEDRWNIAKTCYCKGTPKTIKQKILYLSIEEKKNSQS